MIEYCVNCNTVKGSEDSGYPCEAEKNGVKAPPYHIWTKGRGFKGQRDDSPVPKHPAPDKF